ncbi:MAG: hypothetical protein NZM31_12150 [Gemmatales bacterium]|nr:hypothetical protein [Gemmatales bacterium]MDW8387747.1 hypothetical protein [Gemmatales bacterium]
MSTERLTRIFASLPAASQIEVLVRVAFELTVLAREYYSPESGIQSRERLREINEVQHLILGHVLALLSADPHRYPDDMLMNLILSETDPELAAGIAAALARSLAVHSLA